MILLKRYEISIDCNLTIDMPNVTSYYILIIDSILGFVLIENIMRIVKDISFLSWTGSHSLVYYFICGGVPLTVSNIFNKIGLTFNGYYVMVIFFFIIVYLISTAITWFIYRYIPFIVGDYSNLYTNKHTR